jgi:hypothetical protein
MIWLTAITAGICLYITLDLPFFNSFVLTLRGVHNILVTLFIYALIMFALLLTRPTYTIGEKETVEQLSGKWTAPTFSGEAALTFSRSGAYDYHSANGTSRSGNFLLVNNVAIRLFTPNSSELYRFELDGDALTISLYDADNPNSLKFLREAK